ncbi:hypothetical protein [Aestuariivirga sp.]|uniref:hypothetical protein n=1 Tax=Aestuariivirga sp. TaxID=2650926 RepID=UPI00391D6BB4
MTRYTMFLLIALGTAASAVAAVAPQQRTSIDETDTNVTVIEKNQAFPLMGPLTVEECLDSECLVTRG